MTVKFQAWAVVPLDRLRLDWMPVCSENGRRYCLEKDRSDMCPNHSRVPKTGCRRITITIEEAQDGI